MMRSEKRPFQTGNDLVKIYRAAAERVKYLQDIDDKLLAYNEVITYCAHAKQCIADDSVKRNQILFWTYSNIGDMFLERNTHTPMADNYLYAVQYYENALEFCKTESDKHHTLEKLAHVYGELQDEKSWRKTVEQIALSQDNLYKRQAFVELADTTDDIRLQAKYLEYALDFITAENISILEKCQNTLSICARLLEIYAAAKSKTNYERVKELQKKTLELLN